MFSSFIGNNGDLFGTHVRVMIVYQFFSAIISKEQGFLVGAKESSCFKKKTKKSGMMIKVYIIIMIGKIGPS